MSGNDNRKELQTDPSITLIDAVDQMFFSVLLVMPEKNSALVLQSREYPEMVQSVIDWTEYLKQYFDILTEEGWNEICQHLTNKALLAAWQKGKKQFTVEIPYWKENKTNWISISVVMNRSSDLKAYIFVRLSNEEHLLKRIIDLYVYNTCDYFIYLNARENSYVMFNGNKNGTPLPPEVCDDYAAALEDYARSYVVPEDQEMVIREMQVDRVLQQLEQNGVHTFYCSIIEPVRGYTRKQLTYRYYDRDAQMILLSRTDVTDIYLMEKTHREEMKKVLHQAETDMLTGLLNYEGLHSRVERALASERRAAFLFIDLDNFKKVNDSLGHMEGNHLLCQIAEILQKQTGEMGFCGRVGGDEFVVYLRNPENTEQATDCARRICHEVCLLSAAWSEKVSISCSIGIAVAPQDGKDYMSLFSIADQRVYHAKSKGKNRYCLN